MRFDEHREVRAAERDEGERTSSSSSLIAMASDRTGPTSENSNLLAFSGAVTMAFHSVASRPACFSFCRVPTRFCAVSEIQNVSVLELKPKRDGTRTVEERISAKSGSAELGASLALAWVRTLSVTDADSSSCCRILAIIIQKTSRVSTPRHRQT